MDYTAPNIGQVFGIVYFGDKNVAYLVVAAGWARVITIYFFLNCFVVPNVQKGGETIPNVQKGGETLPRVIFI